MCVRKSLTISRKAPAGPPGVAYNHFVLPFFLLLVLGLLTTGLSHPVLANTATVLQAIPITQVPSANQTTSVNQTPSPNQTTSTNQTPSPNQTTSANQVPSAYQPLYVSQDPATGRTLPTYRFDYLLIEDGLPQNTINCITKDLQGFMWFGTNNGLCRYDSYEFEVFQSEGPAGQSLPDNLVRDIAVDSRNRVWIGSSRGLSYFDPFTHSIVAFRDSSWQGKAIEGVRSLVIHDSIAWVGTVRTGVFRIALEDEAARVSAHYSTGNGRIPNDQVNVIYRDPRGTVYVGSDEGAYVLDRAADRFTVPDDSRALPAATFVNDIFEDDRQRLYFSTRNGLFVHAGGELTWHAPDADDPLALNHATVNKVRQDVSGQLLVATLGGLHAFFPGQEIFLAFPEQGHEHFALNNAFISTVYSDTLGNVWIGTEKGGINKFNVYQHPFLHFTNDPNDPNSLNVNTVNSIYSEHEELWIGTAGGGLNHLNMKTGRFSHHTYDATDAGTLSSNFVSAILRGSDNTLWTGTWGGGLNAVYTGGRHPVIERTGPAGQRYSGSMVDAFVSTLVEDPEGFLMIGTEGGLWMLNYAAQHFTALTAPEGFQKELGEIGCALLDSKGYYWIGTREGLFRFSRSFVSPTTADTLEIGGLEYFGHDSGDEYSLPGDYIISLMEDSRGNLWIGTYSNGLVHAEVDGSGALVCRSYTTDDGLSNNVVYGIVEDRDGRIWMSTDNGISMLDPATDQTRRFYMHDGLLSNQFYWSAAHVNEYGTIFFGGVEGLNYFNPSRFFDYSYLPLPKITRFKIHNREVLPGVSYYNQVAIDRPIYSADTIRLTYRGNNISFEFSSMDAYLPEKSRYAYMLTGVDQDWVNVSSSRRFANYNYLEGGTYTFLLKASNGDGLWSEEPTAVTIIVTPPFWKTGWFAALMVAFVVLLTYGIVRYQVRRIVAQKRLLEEKVKRRTREIEEQKVRLEEQAHELMLLNEKVNEVNQVQLRFFTNISHEFQTPLTLITSPVERLIRQFRDNNEVIHLLKIVDRNAQRLLMLIRQLLEIRKIETGHQTLQVELTDARTFIQEIFTSFEELAGRSGIDYRSELSLGRSAWIDKEKLENVLYNLLSNAFKFSHPGASIVLRAMIQKREDTEYLTVSVADTGEGIPADKLDKLYDRFQQLTGSRKQQRAGAGIGLSMAKSLVEVMHGAIAVDSEQGKGTTFTVTLPVSRHSFEEDEIDTTGQVFESNIRDKVAILYDQITGPVPVDHNVYEGAVDTVLVVEDNDDMRSFICSSLAPYFKVLEAENGEDGMEQAVKDGPAIIVSDIMMPGMDGIELCNRLKSNLYTSHIPVILLTAKSGTDDQVKGLETGADDYVTKPFNVEVLVARVRTLIHNRSRVREKFSRLEAVDPDDGAVSPLDRKFYDRAVDIVGKHYADPAFDVDLFASEMLVSRSQLYSKLKAITNLSANEFINTYRLKRSYALLEQGELQISEIAYETGFNDPKYFSRIFRKYFQEKPSEVLRKR